ncbi:hypothetical protein Tco_0519633 [Tanacetum coccineum]
MKAPRSSYTFKPMRALMYLISFSAGAKGLVNHQWWIPRDILAMHNMYEAGQKKVAFTYLTEKAGDKEEACSGCIISEGDLFMTGTQPGLLEPTTARWQDVPRTPGMVVVSVVLYSHVDSRACECLLVKLRSLVGTLLADFTERFFMLPRY